MLKIQRDNRENLALAPKPVHPTAIRTHGLFGISFLRQHMIMDNRWTVKSTSEEYQKMSDLLARRLIFKRLEFNANRKRYNHENSLLRRQCREGRAKLQMSVAGQNTRDVRNILINHKDMQRLYQKMPIHLVVDNINQRTFVLRKERDRLQFRLDQLKAIYKKKLLARALVENRIRYQDEYVLDEELKSRDFMKKLENSNVRLRAIKAINGTYKKMIQILRHDSIFYEPILRALCKDTEDQANFIKHILYMGMPAISKFRELGEDYRKMEDKAHKNLQSKLQFVANFKNKLPHSSSRKTGIRPLYIDRYVRETESMLEIKTELETIEQTIKTVKYATLCSQGKEIFPRMKSQVDNNLKLKKMIENDNIGYRALETKSDRAQVLESVLINNLSEEESKRMERIQSLQSAIDEQYKLQEETVKYLKNRGDVYVLFRFGLWNINDILRHVDRPPKSPHIKYPNSYLQLPLLKFEMLNMYSYPPEGYEENLNTIMKFIKRKLEKLMTAYTTEISKNRRDTYIEEYHTMFLESMDLEDLSENAQQEQKDTDSISEIKTLQNVPNRKQIKDKSAKVVEEFSKRED